MKPVLVNTIAPLIEQKHVQGEEGVRLCGANTGNACFADAIQNQLDTNLEVDCYKIQEWEDKEKFVFVLPASNWINSDGRVLRRTFLPLENTDVNLLTLGIGIQMNIDDRLTDFVSRLGQDTIRALHILSEHSRYIGVRGNITGECLDMLHIHNWKVIGCPSFYEPYRKNSGVWKLREPTLSKPIINVTPGRTSEHKIIKYGYNRKILFMMQAMADMPLSIWEDKDIEQRHIEQKFPGLSIIQPGELKEYIKKYGNIFFTANEWSDFLRKGDFSFSVGSRFHGNMMALINDIPALWIMHDARTKELIEAMNLPYVMPDDVNKSISLEELMANCHYDDKFYTKYKELSRQYVELLNVCNVQHTFGDISD